MVAISFIVTLRRAREVHVKARKTSYCTSFSTLPISTISTSHPKLSLKILPLVSISDELRNGMLYSFQWDRQSSLSRSVLSLVRTINIYIILAMNLNNIDQYLKPVLHAPLILMSRNTPYMPRSTFMSLIYFFFKISSDYYATKH